MKRIGLLIAVLCTIAAFTTAATATNDKITICHVAGLASDPANYITLHLPPQAVYGNGGHFNENGTTQAGHEQDTMGECNPPPPPHDECPLIPGDQPEGTDCDPVEPPCTVNCEPPPCTENCTPTPPPPPPPPGERCPPGMVPTNGKDGEEGNDECEYPQTTTTAPAPSVSVPSDVATLSTPAPTVTATSSVTASSKPKAAKPTTVKKPQPVKLTGDPKKDKCVEQKNNLLKCNVGGKTITVVPGNG
jgi:hypothetical protein